MKAVTTPVWKVRKPLWAIILNILTCGLAFSVTEGCAIVTVACTNCGVIFKDHFNYLAITAKCPNCPTVNFLKPKKGYYEATY